MLSKEFIQEMKERLIDQQEKLETELAGLSVHEELGGDMDSNAQEVETDDVSRDVMAKIKTDLAKISKALDKIEAGSYGTDDEGKEINQDRLNALPWADKAI
ncbi:MAG: hypothetical protein WC794_02265 [Candidatus Doudnabacteria bacterium]|jgi:RNA polymerase-binding transcription factor DksA